MAGLWPYRSHDDLKAAGYYLIRGRNGEEHTWCKDPGCKAVIMWYRTPNGARMPVDAKTYMTHWATCKGRPKGAEVIGGAIAKSAQGKLEFDPETREPGQEG